MGLGGLVLGSPILYLKGMRLMMFQLSSFYCIYAVPQQVKGYLLRYSGSPFCDDQDNDDHGTKPYV